MEKNETKTETSPEEDFSAIINDCAKLSNELLLKLRDTQKYVSASFYKQTVQVLTKRIEINISKLVEKSPEKEILARKAVNLIHNADASAELDKLCKKYGL